MAALEQENESPIALPERVRPSTVTRTQRPSLRVSRIRPAMTVLSAVLVQVPERLMPRYS